MKVDQRAPRYLLLFFLPGSPLLLLILLPPPLSQMRGLRRRGKVVVDGTIGDVKGSLPGLDCLLMGGR